MQRHNNQPSPIRPGLYHIVLEPTQVDDIYAPSHGVILQFKHSFGYFTLPGPSREAVAFLADVYPDGTALVEFPQTSLDALGAKLSTEHRQRLAKPYRPKRNRWERERDALWSEVARRRAAGEEVKSLFGATVVLDKPVSATFYPALSQHSPQVAVDVEIVEVYRPGVGWVRPQKRAA